MKDEPAEADVEGNLAGGDGDEKCGCVLVKCLLVKCLVGVCCVLVGCGLCDVGERVDFRLCNTRIIYLRKLL